MYLRRWLGLIALTPGLVVVFVVGFLVGDQVGLKDTPATRASFVATAVACCLIGWFLARWKPVPRAVWSLPVGVCFATAFWLQVRRTPELSLGVGVTVIGTWVAALTLVSVVTAALASRSPFAAIPFAVVAAVLLVVLVPFLAVRLSMGAAMAPWNSVATWTLAGLTDGAPGVDILRRHALEIASGFSIVVMTGTSYVLGYTTGLPARARRSRSCTSVDVAHIKGRAVTAAKAELMDRRIVPCHRCGRHCFYVRVDGHWTHIAADGTTARGCRSASYRPDTGWDKSLNGSWLATVKETR